MFLTGEQDQERSVQLGSRLPMVTTSKLASVFMEAKMTAQSQASRELQKSRSRSTAGEVHEKGFWRRHLKPPQHSGLHKLLRLSKNSYEYSKDFRGPLHSPLRTTAAQRTSRTAGDADIPHKHHTQSLSR